MNPVDQRGGKRREQQDPILLMLAYLAGLFLISFGTAAAITLTFLLNGHNWTGAITVGGGFAAAIVVAVGSLIRSRRLRYACARSWLY